MNRWDRHLWSVFVMQSCWLMVAFTASAQELRVGGYLEHQVYPQSLRGKTVVMDYTKGRIDLGGEVSTWLAFSGDLVGQVEHGTRKLNSLDYLPASVVEAYAASRNEPFSSFREDFSFELKHSLYVDNAFATVYVGGASLRVGRQQLPWGTGYAWNPSDIFLEKNFLDPTYEKRGVDAVKIVVPTSGLGSVTGVMAVDAPWRNARKAIRLSQHLAGFDISVSVLEAYPKSFDYLNFSSVDVRRRFVAADFSGAIGEFGVWAEGTHSNVASGSAFEQVLLGLDHTTEAGLYVMMEYFHNGAGAADTGHYTFSGWMDLVAGESEQLGRDYLFLGQSYPLTDLLVASGYWIVNLSDRSLVAYPYVEYSLSDNAVLTCIAYLTTGGRESEFGSFGWGAILRGRLYF